MSHTEIPVFKDETKLRNIKTRLREAKRFTRFYFNKFTPLTQLERDDLKESRMIFRIFTTVGAGAMYFASFRMRRIKLMTSEMHEYRAPNMVAMLVQDAAMAFFGFTAAQIYAAKWIYDARSYVRERLTAEREVGFSRKDNIVEECHDEYTFLPVTSDKMIRTMRKLGTDDPRELAKVERVNKRLAGKD